MTLSEHSIEYEKDQVNNMKKSTGSGIQNVNIVKC